MAVHNVDLLPTVKSVGKAIINFKPGWMLKFVSRPVLKDIMALMIWMGLVVRPAEEVVPVAPKISVSNAWRVYSYYLTSLLKIHV